MLADDDGNDTAVQQFANSIPELDCLLQIFNTGRHHCTKARRKKFFQWEIRRRTVVEIIRKEFPGKDPLGKQDHIIKLK